jgi:tetratricopeptide (TPR) repeat protein
MMNKNLPIRLVFLLLSIFSIASCFWNSEFRREQAEASRKLGEAYIIDGNYTRALKELLKAEKQYPDDHILHNDLGIVYKEKGRYDLAIKHFKKALKFKPNYAPARNNLGTAYFEKKDWDAAIICFKQVSNNLLYATPHYPLYNLGRAYYHKKEYLLSEKYYIGALDKKPNFAVALQGLGKTYISMGKIPEALAALESAVKAAPEFAQAYFNLGEAYQLSRRYKKARDAYNKVISLESEASLVLKAQKEINKLKKY